MLKRLRCLFFGHEAHYFLAPLDQKVMIQHHVSVNGGPEQEAGKTVHIVEVSPRLMVVTGANGKRMELDECRVCGELVRVRR